MWNYLKKNKNNHTTSSLPQKTRSNASPDKRIWTKGPATFKPLNWHCFRFALSHHLFQHPLSPYDEKSAQDVAKLLPRMKEQASTATTTTHPLFMTPFTPEEKKNEIQKLLADKLPGPSGITNRMLQAGDTDFQGLILIFFNGVWEFHTQPSDWQLSLLQPIYKEHNKDKTDPASYRGMYLNDTLAKLFEGLLIARLTTHTALFTPHTTQSKSSEDYPKGVVLARPYSVYLSLILFTNSEPNFPSGYLPWTLTAKPTHPRRLRPGSTKHIWIGGLSYVDDLALMSICPRELQSMLYACQHLSIRNRMQINTEKRKNNGLLRNPCPPLRPGGSTPALPNHATLSFVLTLSNLRPSLVPYPRSLPI